MFTKHGLGPVFRVRAAGMPHRAMRRWALPLAVLSLLVVGLAAGPVLAQSPQPGTPAPAPSVPPGNNPRAEGPAQATPEPDMSEEDEDGGEGCPYLGQPLELVV